MGAEGVSRDSRDIKNFSHYLLWQVVLVNSCSGRGKMKFSCGQSCWRLSDKPGMRQRRPSPFLCWLPFPLCTATETNVLATFGISRDRNKLCGRRRLLSVRIVYYAILIISSKHWISSLFFHRFPGPHLKNLCVCSNILYDGQSLSELCRLSATLLSWQRLVSSWISISFQPWQGLSAVYLTGSKTNDWFMHVFDPADF